MSRTHYRTTALIISCGLFMQNLDTTVLATALPTMARDLHVAPAGISVALTSYLLALAIFVPASGTIADRFGARRVYQSAIALFVLGSVACGFSTDLNTLVAARFVQGIGGAMMVPVGRLVLLRSVDRKDMISAVSWLTMPGLIGPVLGPPAGGFIVTYLDWRWIFWINVPMGILGVALVQRFIEDIAAAEVRPFDWRGFAISGLALSATIFGLQLAGRAGERWLGLLLLLAGLAGGLAYAWHARRKVHAILDLTLLRVPTFRLSLVGGTLLRITQGAQPFLVPMLMQFAFGLSAATSGIVTGAPAVGAIVMKAAARPILRRLGFRNTLVCMGVIVPACFAVAGLFRPDWPLGVIAAVLLVSGFFSSLQFTAYNTIAYDGIEPERISAATTLYSTFQQVSLSLGVSVASATLAEVMALNGHTWPGFGDFSIAIWAVAAISLLAVFPNLRFDKGAGAEMSGSRRVGAGPTR